MKGVQISKQMIIALVAVISLVSFAIVRWIFMSKKYSTRFDGRLPFAIEEQLNSSISKYLEEYPVKNQIFISAPYQAGKSRLLNQIADRMTQEGRLVFNLDFSNVHSYDDFLKMFRIACVKNLYQIKSILPSSNLKKLPTFPLIPKENLTEGYQLPLQLRELYNSIYASLENLGEHFDTRPFLQISRYLREAYPVLRPVIIIHNFDKLLDSKQCEKYIANIHLINSCHVFLELEDSALKLDRRFINTHRFIEIAAPRSSAEKTFVQKFAVFAPGEYRKIVSSFGENYGIFSIMHEALKSGLKLDEAIKNELNHTKALVQSTLAQQHVRRSQLPICSDEDLTSGNDIIKTISQIEPYRLFLKKGLIYIRNDLSFTAANKAIHSALCS